MNQDELKQHYDVYTDCWRFLRKYSEPDDSDAFWEQVVRESQKLYKKYGTEFAKQEVVNVVNEIERICKKQRK